MSAVVIVGNPRPGSRTLSVATSLGNRLAAHAGAGQTHVVDLATIGPRLFDLADAEVIDALEQLKSAAVAVIASPTYKASFSGLLKLFLDRIPAGALSGVGVVVPLMTGGAANHALAVEVHLRPVLVELGARMPSPGLYITESQLADVEAVFDHWFESARPLSNPPAPLALNHRK